MISSEYGANTYAYGADGQRVTKASSAGTFHYVRDLDGSVLVDYKDNSWYGLAQYSKFNGQTLARISNYDTAASTDITWSFNDWLGTTHLRLAMGGGIPRGVYSSLPFGDALTTTSGNDGDPHHYTGKERDTESGLDYFGARYYGSNMGRFLSPDYQDLDDDNVPEAIPSGSVINPQSLNLYAYARINPLSRRDYDGHASWQDCGDGSGSLCWIGDYNGEQNNGLFWNSQSKEWQGSDPNPPPDSDPAGMFFTGLTRAMLGQSHGYQQMGRALMLDGPTLGMKSLAALIPFGRPSFVPQNWDQKEPGRGRRDGVKFQDPNNPHNSVRIMKGDPNSSNPGQQKAVHSGSQKRPDC